MKLIAIAALLGVISADYTEKDLKFFEADIAGVKDSADMFHAKAVVDIDEVIYNDNAITYDN